MTDADPKQTAPKAGFSPRTYFADGERSEGGETGTSMQDHWNLDQLRADTAGCEHTIFFNNAGASLQPRPVVARVIQHLQLEEQIGGHAGGGRVTRELGGGCRSG